MHFVQRLRTIWSWLPSFRAVAETQHLPTAAQELGVVPSSLSRMVKLLEDELGLPLFDRTTKALVLNEAGRTLQLAVREAMRVIDEALAAMADDAVAGNVSAVATAELAHTVLVPASALLASRYPRLVIATKVARESEIADLLLRGDADAAVVHHAPIHPELRATELARWSRAAFARTGCERAAEPTCVVVGTPEHHADDGWPADWSRSVTTWVHDELAALELVLRTDHITVAFDASVRAAGLADRLDRLEGPEIASRALYVLHRRAVGSHRRTDVLVAAIRDAIATI